MSLAPPLSSPLDVSDVFAGGFIVILVVAGQNEAEIGRIDGAVAAELAAIADASPAIANKRGVEGVVIAIS